MDRLNRILTAGTHSLHKLGSKIVRNARYTRGHLPQSSLIYF